MDRLRGTGRELVPNIGFSELSHKNIMGTDLLDKAR